MPLPARLAVLVVLAVGLAGSARAELFTACTVMPTADGFVALRAKPSLKGRILARMRAGEVVVIETKNGKYVESGSWIRVSHYPGEEMPLPSDAEFKDVRTGWAKSRFVDECG
jgi:hypothetical protein